MQKIARKKGVSLSDFIPQENIGIVWRNPAMPVFYVQNLLTFAGKVL